MSKRTVNVSVITSNYNCGRFLDMYFTSIRKSTVCPREIIFIDDGSTDDSIQCLGKYRDLEGLVIIGMEQNIGLANALNKAIERSVGEYLMRLDPDDFIFQDRIENQYNYLKNHPEIDLVGSNVLYCTGNSNHSKFRSNVPEIHGEIVKEYRKGNHGIFHTSVMGKTKVFSTIRYNQDSYPVEDYDFFTRAIQKGYLLANIPETLTYYRVHSHNLSDRYLKSRIEKTLITRKTNLNIPATKFYLWLKLLQTFYYRGYLKKTGTIRGVLYLMMAGLFNPRRMLKRIRLN